LAEQKRIQTVLGQGMTPEVQARPAQMVEEEGRYIGETPAVAARPAGFDLARIAPQLLGSEAGRKTLADLVSTQKAMTGETFKLGEGEKQYQRDFMTGEVKEVASGAPKVAKLTGKEGNAALMFYGTDDVTKLRGIPNAIDKIRIEATTQRKAEQPQINLNDPTAVEAQKLKTLSQWEGALKNSGAMETAMRAQGFYKAYEQAQKGNTTADGALIYNVAKVYDPGGVVQGGDVKNVIGVPSVPEQIQDAARKIANGGTISPKVRENLRKLIDDVVDERSRMIDPSLKTYRKINRGLGGTDDDIANPFDMVNKPKSLNSILGFDRPRGGQ